MRLVRKNSTPIKSYNEGLVVFLYDDANTDRIQKANPTILEGFGEEDANDPKLLDLAAEGVLVVFELQGDGDLSIELSVGEPLTKVEIAAGGWTLPVQHARLKLPTGELRIECYNNLQFDPYTEEGEVGDKVSIVPGDYALSLYHRDLLGDEDKDLYTDDAWEVVVLTPHEGSSIEVASPMLRFPIGASDS
jgi:hypothetical protein